MNIEIDSAAYGEVWASDYDQLYAGRDDSVALAKFLTDLAPGNTLLEFGVGTGRLALPLSEAGFAVTGVDASAKMLDRLRGRPGAERLRIITGDFTTVDAGGPFDLVLLAFSTLFLVPTQAGQLACLASARRHLRPGGALVVEAFVPDHSRWARGQNVSVGSLDESGVTLKLSVHDAVTQTITTQDVLVDHHGTRLRPNVLRYAWPAELDAMALASGLTPDGRWDGWDRAAFTGRSGSHVSVYRRPPGGPVDEPR
ncbi:MAG: hypothetical protein QG622_3052 [Actinomycetota bacterium]|nr:hypothetical protein [Actinomycetota bacterium]